MRNLLKENKLSVPISNSCLYRDFFYASCDKYIGKTAFIKKHNNAHINIDYTRLRKEVTFLSYYLLKNFKDKKVVLIGKNSYELCVAYMASLCSGVICVPLDAGLKLLEIKTSIERANPSLIICDMVKYDLLKKEEISSPIVLLENTDPENVSNSSIGDIIENESLNTSLHEAENFVRQNIIDENEIKLLLFTSGTTSTPKIAKLTNRNLTANIKSLQKIMPLKENDGTLALLPLHHLFGSTGVLFFISSGAYVAFVDSIKKFKDNLKEYSPSVLFLVPAVLEMIYSKIETTAEKKGKLKTLKKAKKFAAFLADNLHIDIKRKLFKSILNELGSNLRLVFVGAAAASKKLIEDFDDLGITVFQGYGMTEASPVISSENFNKRKAGSVGVIFPDQEIKVDNPDENGIGEFLVKGDNIFVGYMDDVEKTNEVLVDGWCHTGDTGYIDKDGFIYITGRKKDMIVLKNGKKIFPTEIEDILSKKSYVQDVIVFGEEDKDDVRLACKIKIDEKETLEYFGVENVEEMHKCIWNDIKDINQNLPKYKYIKNAYVTEQEFMKTTTLKTKRYIEIDRTYSQLQDGSCSCIK